MNLNPLTWFTTNETSTVSMRDMLSSFGVSHNGGRDLFAIFGYKRNLRFRDYYAYYRHQDYANRVLTMVPKSCWRDGAELTDEEDMPVDEETMKAVRKTGIYNGLEKADILNRIGKFSILVVGVPDGLDPAEELGKASPDRLGEVFYSAFAEDGIVITKWDQDILSPRFGLPAEYNVQLIDRGDKEQAIPLKAFRVHWSRVVHMAEGALDNEIEGLPFLEPIVNRLDDLNKTIGGSAEAYFRNARGKTVYETQKGSDGQLNDDDVAALKSASADFQNGWSDSIHLNGLTASTLDTPQQDPKGTISGALEAVSGYSGIPIRILTGVGAGQLAGNEDKASYNQTVQDRQNAVCAPWFSDAMTILQNAGMIQLSDDHRITWPELQAPDEKQASETNLTKADAFLKVTQALDSMTLDGNVDPAEVYREILGLELEVDDEPDEEIILEPPQSPETPTPPESEAQTGT